MTESKTNIPNEDLQPINDIDRTVHSPARLMILALLSVVESVDFTFLLTQTGLTRGKPLLSSRQTGGSRIYPGGQGIC